MTKKLQMHWENYYSEESKLALGRENKKTGRATRKTNQILQGSSQQWKTAIVVPIRKPNKDASCMGSYRPIALTCMTCKLMERIILRKITFHLMNRNMLPQEQYGFRKGHSTIDQILYFVQRVRDAHNMKPSRHTMAVFSTSLRDWGADAGTLKITYTALVRPILEYGYQIYQVVANTNLKKLERIQFSAARIITGLRHSCPNDIACYEADLQPLSPSPFCSFLAKRNNMAKYVAKLKSFKPYNRSSNLLSNWANNQKIKKDSPLGLIWKQGLADIEVEPSVPFNLLTLLLYLVM
ncbi:putative RNA-directed DNA polymerase from transposon BS [Caerostris extrusa]|uniref:RNA-directed DNA polymerase from transposon BS n=1 Tax=Caerostris extrusa TaxID=172846 RepID=A0AAV4M684_CAEEX|nr:putative RNA-directed DNA polymerase from transposon BS [Caerostris extrusa]